MECTSASTDLRSACLNPGRQANYYRYLPQCPCPCRSRRRLIRSPSVVRYPIPFQSPPPPGSVALLQPVNMRPLFQRPTLLARQFTLRGFASAVGGRRQQLSIRPVCLQCQLLVVRRQPYSIGLGSNPPSGTHPSNENKPADEQKPQERPAENEEPPKDAKPSNSPRVDITKLPSTIESKRIRISKRISAAMNDLQGTLFVAGKRLNEVTGYAGIEQMKKAIEAQGIFPSTSSV